jgi:hypothetical protein
LRKARTEREQQPSPNLSLLIENLEDEAALLTRLGRATEAAALESELTRLRGMTPPAQKYELGALKTTKASTEGSVVIELDGTTLPDSTYKNYDLATLETQLSKILESEAVGELDGHEYGAKNVTIFLYGADGEEVFRTIEPILREYPLCDGARVSIRQGARERQVVVTTRFAD